MKPDEKRVRPRPKSAAGRTILLVEDEPVILLNLELTAKELGCSCVCACSSDDALQKLGENEDIDAAVLDVRLANGSNCAPVAAKLYEKSVPFVLHSANLAQNNKVIDRFSARLIPKPAPPEQVLAAAIALSSSNRSGNSAHL